METCVSHIAYFNCHTLHGPLDGVERARAIFVFGAEARWIRSSDRIGVNLESGFSRLSGLSRCYATIAKWRNNVLASNRFRLPGANLVCHKFSDYFWNGINLEPAWLRCILKVFGNSILGNWELCKPTGALINFIIFIFTLKFLIRTWRATTKFSFNFDN